jgi:hypothetical protein
MQTMNFTAIPPRTDAALGVEKRALPGLVGQQALSRAKGVR